MAGVFGGDDHRDEQVSTRTLILLAFSATAGVMVEFYDFFLFAYAAASAFPALFFPDLPPTEALVFSYLIFAAGFPARLLGAFTFGHFGDRVGRKFAFLINITLVGLTTCLTGLLPGYATLGIGAPILLVTLRILQGIGLGGEFGGASALLAEFGARRKHRAFWISLANLGIAFGGIAASGVMLLLSDSFATGGWRIAMLLSAVIAIPALLARYKLADSPLFERVKKRDRVVRMPSVAVFRSYGLRIVLLSLVFGFQQMDGIISGTYMISFMNLAGVPLTTTASLLVIGRLGDAAGIVISGPCADFLNRKAVAYGAIALTTALSYPFVMAVLSRQVVAIAVLQFFITFLGVGILHGLAPILTSESFPTKYRYSGAGLAFNLSAIVGGMMPPSILAGLIGQDAKGKWYYVILVYAIYCVVSMVALAFIPETRDIRLEELDD